MIGDVLTSTVLCDTLKVKFPNCTIHFVANHNTLAVLDHNPHIDKVIVFKPEYKERKVAFYRFLKSLQTESYDAVFDAYGKLESNLMSLFAKSKLKTSYTKWYSKWIYTHTYKTFSVPDTTLTLSIKNRLQLLQPLGITIQECSCKPQIHLTNKEKENAKLFLQQHGIDTHKPIVMISVLGSSKKKTYPAVFKAQVIDAIAKEIDGCILFNYIPSQLEEAKEVYDFCSEETQRKIKFDVYASCLRDFLAVLSHCKAIIGNEGGAINMGKALNVPTFAIFAPFTTKEGWFVENETDVAVHLKELKPNLYIDKKRKEIIADSSNYYKMFEPHIFKDKLISFIHNHV